MTAGVERVEANLTLPSQVVGQEVEGSAIGLPAGYEDILSRWGQCNSLQAINIIHDVYIMQKNKWGVMVNTCKEFQLLPLSKGYASIRDFATP